jgi:sarcosine oxidase subunit alpha
VLGDDLRRLPPARPRGEPISIDVDGELVRAYTGEPVAVALFAENVRALARSPKYHRPRGLFCATGHCGSCLMRIDGQPNVRACMVPARADLRCQRQNTFPDPEIDLLAAADWLFPGGMDHHRLMTGSRIGNDLFVKLVRQMGGSGLLPEQPAPAQPAPRDVTVEICIVGGGPAGLSAATAIARARAASGDGAQVLLVDDQPELGGSLLAEPHGGVRAAELVAAARAAGVRLEPGAVAIGLYHEEVAAQADGTSHVLAVVTTAGLIRVRARRFVYATGAYDQNLPMPDNDRPGILAARALGRLAFFWGMAPPPGRRVVLVPGPGPRFAYLDRLAAGLHERGVEVIWAEDKTLGAIRPRLDLRADVIGVGPLPAPASELWRQHGGTVELDLERGGFCAVRAPDGDAAAGIFATGDIAGFCGPEAAAADGTRVGTAIAALAVGR